MNKTVILVNRGDFHSFSKPNTIYFFRYLFYDINFQEGFNLRRDVYIRFAVLAHEMNKSSNSLLNKFSLVLPPWSHLIHWKSKKKLYTLWNLYFDLESLKKFAPVIEIYDFFKG